MMLGFPLFWFFITPAIHLFDFLPAVCGPPSCAFCGETLKHFVVGFCTCSHFLICRHCLLFSSGFSPSILFEVNNIFFACLFSNFNSKICFEWVSGPILCHRADVRSEVWERRSWQPDLPPNCGVFFRCVSCTWYICSELLISRDLSAITASQKYLQFFPACYWSVERFQWFAFPFWVCWNVYRLIVPSGIWEWMLKNLPRGTRSEPILEDFCTDFAFLFLSKFSCIF